MSPSDIKELKNGYRYFSIVFHICVVFFLLYIHYIKKPDVNINIKLIKLVGLLSILTGVIFYFYGNDLVN